MNDFTSRESTVHRWEALHDVFYQWLGDNKSTLKPGLKPEPTIKVLIFLALLETQQPCTYRDIRDIFEAKGVIKGIIPDNTLRTSILNLGKTLDKSGHPLTLMAERGTFQLIPRSSKVSNPLSALQYHEPIVFLLDPPAIKAEDIAQELVEKARLPFHALYLLEWSARWWEIFSNSESQIRVQYEAGSLDTLNITKRLLNNPSECISVVGLATGEGLAEIALLKKILAENPGKKFIT
jgi:hypothetical protein